MSLSVLFAGAALTACDVGRDGNDNTAAKVLPEDTEFFASVALSPSLEQKAALFQLSQKLPESAKASSQDAIPGDFINDLVKDDGLTYDADIKPWLGGEAAFAVLKPEAADGDPLAVGMVAVKDQAKAQAALDKAKAKSADYRFVGEYLFVVDSSTAGQAAGLDEAEAAKTQSRHLSDSTQYKDSIARLSGEHLLLGYVDVSALARTAYSSKSLNEGASSELTPYAGLLGGTTADSEESTKTKDEVLKQTDKIGAVSFSVRATSNSVVMEASAKDNNNTSNESLDLLEHLPSDTLAAYSVGKLGDSVSKALDLSNPDSTLSQYVGDDASLKDQINTPTAKAAIDLVRSIDGEADFAVGDVTGDTPEYGFIANTSKSNDATSALAALVTSAKDSGFEVTPITLDNNKAGYSFAAPASDPAADSTSSDDFFGDFGDNSSNDLGSDTTFDDSNLYGQAAATPGTSVVAAVVNNKTVVIASSADYATKLIKGGDLGTTQRYKDAVTTGDKSVALYLDLSQVGKIATTFDPSALDDPDTKQVVDHLDSFSVTSKTDSGYSKIEARLTFR